MGGVCFTEATGGSGIILAYLGRALVSPLKIGVKKLCSEGGGAPPHIKRGAGLKGNLYTSGMNKNIQSLPLRNIGIVAHVDAGKTTTSERILYYSDVIHRIGEVDSGSATMDWMDQERDRGITITSAATHLQWGGVGVNLIDTPGHVDFTAEVERSLRVLDGAVVIFDAVNGVEPQSETVWKQANRYGVPRLVHINKLDRVGADFKAAYIDITRKLKVHGDVELLALVVPGREAEGGELTGVIDVLTEEYIVWEAGGDGSKWTTSEIPGVMRGEVDEWRDRVFTVLGDHNEKIANDYLNTGAVDCELCYAEIRRLTIAREIFPVFCGASLRNIGVQPLLDGVVRYLPAPEELPAVQVFDRDGERTGEVERNPGGSGCWLWCLRLPMTGSGGIWPLCGYTVVPCAAGI